MLVSESLRLHVCDDVCGSVSPALIYPALVQDCLKALSRLHAAALLKRKRDQHRSDSSSSCRGDDMVNHRDCVALASFSKTAVT